MKLAMRALAVLLAALMALLAMGLIDVGRMVLTARILALSAGCW